ncbi:MAG: GTPase Era [Myxococcota bacterium]|nr:GTPase Era [Myxococcota bacterium]
MSEPRVHRSGYVAIVGRPNVGKSTLLNDLLGEKISIVSRRPQTTRNRVMGIYNREDAQVVFLDTPGIHQARKLLNKRMVDAALAALEEVDLVLFMIEAARDQDPEGVRALLETICSKKVPVLLVPNKIDLVSREALLPLMAAWSEVAELHSIVPISARNGDGTGQLIKEITRLLPEGPAYFPKDQLTDATERFVVSELIREQVFRYLDKELPYATAVEIEEFQEGKTVRILARIWVERDSQKGIVIGKGGSMLKRIGTSARLGIERLLQNPVYLKITVGVKRDWTARRQSVEQLGNFGEGKS